VQTILTQERHAGLDDERDFAGPVALLLVLQCLLQRLAKYCCKTMTTYNSIRKPSYRASGFNGNC